MTAPHASSSERWLIYALGGGMGHVTRALSLARQAARRGIRTRILSNSPFAGRIRASSTSLVLDADWIQLVEIPSWLGRDAVVEVTRNEVSRCDAQQALIVDTFPRGLGGELSNVLKGLRCLKVLIHRDLSEEYVQWAKLDECRNDYDLMIVPGESAPLEKLADARTDSWLICDANELLSTEDARQELGCDQNHSSPLIVVTGCGTVDESRLFAQLALKIDAAFGDRATVRFVSLEPLALREAGGIAVQVWPLLKALPGVDLLVGSGGYNTVYEARACDVPLLAIPQARLYDRQKSRLSAAEFMADEATLLQDIKNQLDAMRGRAPVAALSFQNGASAACELIEQRIRGRH